MDFKFNPAIFERKKDFESLYKNWGRFKNQDDRRKELLASQKRERKNNYDESRDILRLVHTVEEDLEYHKTNKVQYRPTIYVAGFHKASQNYRDVLMKSEWMVQKPEDFAENWFVVAAPKGARVLVVTNRGKTKCYSKYGQFMFESHTALPGGNSHDQKERVQHCVLDCIWQEKNNTMYILDLLAWNNQPMTDCDMEFRQYWLTSQLEILPELKFVNRKNAIIFSLLPKVSCEPQSFNEFMMKFPLFEGNFTLLDGLLFYHKNAHYVGGETPLVGWLFPYMVQEVLGYDITVNEIYKGYPVGYTNQVDFITLFEEKSANRKKAIIGLTKKKTIKGNSKQHIDDMEAEDTGIPKQDCSSEKSASESGALIVVDTMEEPVECDSETIDKMETVTL